MILEKRNFDTKAYNINITFASGFQVENPKPITLKQALKFYEDIANMYKDFTIKTMTIVDTETGELLKEFSRMRVLSGKIITTTTYNVIDSHILERY